MFFSSLTSRKLISRRYYCQIPTFLKHLNPKKSEIKFYNDTFGSKDEKKYVIVKVGGAVLTNNLAALTNSIKNLKTAGLLPIIIHGAGPQLNSRLESAGIEPHYIEGMRVTDKNTLKIAVNTFREENTKLCESLQKSDLPVKSFVGSDALYGKCIDFKQWEYVGEVSKIDKTALVENDIIPVIASVVKDEESPENLLNVNADIVAVNVASAIAPYMVVFVNDVGGIKDGNGNIIPELNITKDYKFLMIKNNSYWVKYGTKLKFKSFYSLTNDHDINCKIWLTDALKLDRLLIDDIKSEDSTLITNDKATTPTPTPTPPPPPTTTTKSNTFKTRNVGIIGARGYVGGELIKLIDAHEHFNISLVSSRMYKGKKLNSIIPEISSELEYDNVQLEDIKNFPDIDVWVMALPNGYAEAYVNEVKKTLFDKKQPVIIDLSADYRFNPDWQYGLPERFRENISSATLISNPGCYATGAQLSVLPLVKYLKSPPAIFGVSGFSGAGTTPSKMNDPIGLKDNMIPYKLCGHIHEREVSLQLGTNVHFMPHVASFFRGITLTTNLQLKQSLSQQTVNDIYSKYYEHEKLIHVIADVPEVKNNANKHHVCVGGFTVNESENRVTVVTTLDNLLKGAATQALQNMNLALGYDEYTGLDC